MMSKSLGFFRHRQIAGAGAQHRDSAGPFRHGDFSIVTHRAAS